MLPVDMWYDAITIRHSRRKYTGERVPDDILSKLEEISKSLHPIPGARSVLLRETPKDLFKGIVGSYGAVTDAPHCIVLIGDMTKPHVQESAGYHGEGLVLEATANKVDTCWIGGFLRREVLGQSLEIMKDEQVLGVIAMGYAFENKSNIERMMSGLIGSERRKELGSLLRLTSEQPKGWMLRALEAARRAPSAVNRQPWRFRITDDSIEIFTMNGKSKSISPRLDCGIAMLHLELGAHKAGIKGRWELHNEEPFAIYRIN